MLFSRLSIKYMLYVVVLVTALPAIHLLINSGVELRNHDISDAKGETQKLADAIFHEQNALVLSTRQFFITLAEMPELKQGDSKKVQTLLTEVHKNSPQYLLVFVADRSGKIWASSIPAKSQISIAERRYFTNALKSGQLSSGECIVGKTTNKATINFGYPVKDATGQVNNVICVAIALDHYKHVLGEESLAKGASYSLLDYKGTVLARAVESEKYVGKPSNPEIFKHMNGGAETETSLGSSSVVGDNRVQTYRKVRLEGETEPYMYIRVGIPIDAVLSQSNKSLIQNLILYGVALSLACFVSWFLGKRYVVDKINLLKQSSQRLADGDLSIRISTKLAGGELGELSKSFDVMAEKLSSRETALASSERFLNTIIDSEPDCVKLLDIDCRVQLMNKAGLQMIQADNFEQVRGHCVIPICLPEYQEEYGQIVKEVINGTPQKYVFEITGIKNRRLWLESHMLPFKDDETGSTLALCITRDITEQKKADEANRVLSEQLARSQKVESVGQLAGGIAHDLNNLLTPIFGYTGMALSEVEESSKVYQRLQGILAASEKARKLIQQLLSFSRNQVLNMKNLDIHPVITGFFDILRSAVRESIYLKVNLAQENICISADKDQLEQIIMNLVINAQDAIKENGTITIQTSSIYLDESFAYMHLGAKAGRYLVLSVSDDGCGMDKDTQHRIFEPFFTTKGVGHGTGLGLSSVHGIVKQHGGDIWVYSEVGIGSTFKIYFPIIDEIPETENYEQKVIGGLNGNHSILIVEDNDMVRDITYEVLKNAGYDVTALTEPEQAVTLCDKRDFDLLLTDVVMPDIRGPQLFEIIAKNNSKMKVIYMSGYSSEAISSYWKSGISSEFIQKPFTNQQILALIQKVLSV